MSKATTPSETATPPQIADILAKPDVHVRRRVKTGALDDAETLADHERQRAVRRQALQDLADLTEEYGF